MKASGLFFSLTFLTLLSTQSFGDNFTKNHENKLNSLKKQNQPLSLEDLDHEFTGCPLNSICNEAMAKTLREYKKQSMSKSWEQFLAQQIKKRGALIPDATMTQKNSSPSLEKPSFWHRAHLKKKSETVLWKGATVVKALADKKYHELFQVKRNNQNYPGLFNTFPVAATTNSLIYLVDIEDLTYTLAINAQGKINHYHLTRKQLADIQFHFESVPCPKDKRIIKENNRCKQILNLANNKTETIRKSWINY